VLEKLKRPIAEMSFCLVNPSTWCAI